jgi:myo-inositol-1(or 4)-monophosphatase
MNLAAIKDLVCHLTREVGVFQVSELKHFDRNTIVSKGYNDPVSYVDQESEKMLVKGLKKILPEAGFLTEEETQNTNTDGLHWVIDPLDGTNNFVHQVPFFGISVALCQGREILVGVVHEPNRNECFSAYLGGGAYLNETKIAVSGCKALKNALVATGFPYSLLDKADNYFAIMKDILSQSHGLRRFGSAAMDLCFVACGRFDAYYEFNLHPYDIMAGSLIVREAGGQATTFDLSTDVYDGKEILVTSGFQEELRAVVKKHW